MKSSRAKFMVKLGQSSQQEYNSINVKQIRSEKIASENTFIINYELPNTYLTFQLLLMVLLAYLRKLMALITKARILDKDDDPRFSLDCWCGRPSEDTPQTNSVQRPVNSVGTQADVIPAPLSRRNKWTTTWPRPPFRTRSAATNRTYLTPPGNRNSGAYAWKPRAFGNGGVPGPRFSCPSPSLPVQNPYGHCACPPPQPFAFDAGFGFPGTPRFLAPNLTPVAFGPPWQMQPPNPTAFAAPGSYMGPAWRRQPFPSPEVVLMPPQPFPSPEVVLMPPQPFPSPEVVLMPPQPFPGPGVVLMPPQPFPSPEVVLMPPQPFPGPGVVLMPPQPMLQF